ESRRTFVTRPDPIHPMVIGREVSAWPSQKRDVQFPDRLQNVLTETLGAGERRTLVEDAAIDTAAQVLDKVAIDLGIDIADCALSVDFDARTKGRWLGAQNERRGRERPGESSSGNLHGTSWKALTGYR